MKLAFGILLLYVLCLTALQVANGWRWLFVGLNFLYLAVLAGYVSVLFLGPSLDTQGGLEFQVVAQKVIVYATIVNLGMQALGMRRRSITVRGAGLAAEQP